MTPTYEQLLQGATTWRGNCEGVAYLLSHHGYSEPDLTSAYSFKRDGHPGTWCYYLIVPEQMYPEIWDQFAAQREEAWFARHGPAFDHVEFHSGITWASSEPYYDRKTGRTWDAAKVGCDYNHLWDGEAGYPDTYESVKADAEASCRELVRAFPDRNLRCSYSGLWAPASRFHEAQNGAWVLASAVVNESEHWQPKGGDT